MGPRIEPVMTDTDRRAAGGVEALPLPSSFRDFAAQWRAPIEAALEAVLPPADQEPTRLHAAMRCRTCLRTGPRTIPRPCPT